MVLSDAEESMIADPVATTPANRLSSRSGYAASSMKRATSCAAICIAARGPKRVDSKQAEILVEVAGPWRDYHRLELDLLHSLG